MKNAMTLNALPTIDYAAHPLYGGMFEPIPELGEQMQTALAPIIEKTTEDEHARVERFGYRYSWRDAVSRELAEQGSATRRLPAAAIDAIHAAARSRLELLQGELRSVGDAGERSKKKTAWTGVDRGGELWTAAEQALLEMGLFEATATIFGAPSAKLYSMNVLVNYPDPNWTTRLFRDVEAGAPPTAGFHFDPDHRCSTKMVLYLNDVGPEQGPFGIVPGSHRWDERSQDRIYRSAFDRLGTVTRSAKLRQRFLSLPAEMRTKAEFGGDMIAGSPEAEALLEAEQVMTGPRGQLNLFNPDAIHRGGNVTAGERHVMLLYINPRWDPN
jgi:hypothetical protein